MWFVEMDLYRREGGVKDGREMSAERTLLRIKHIFI
jgi:hypothetical protein